MNHKHFPHEPSPDLPRPNAEYSGLGNSQTDKTEVMQSEQASRVAELPGTAPKASSPIAQPGQSMSSSPPPIQPMAQPATIPVPISPDSPADAQDNDLIEVEWVNKAKAIVDKTREDPHSQNKEINKFKADYIKKRYNKEIKVAED